MDLALDKKKTQIINPRDFFLIRAKKIKGYNSCKNFL